VVDYDSGGYEPVAKPSLYGYWNWKSWVVDRSWQ
jgi:hypothetical protein